MASMKSAWLQFFAVVVLLLAFFAIGSLVYAEPPVITVVAPYAGAWIETCRDHKDGSRCNPP